MPTPLPLLPGLVSVTFRKLSPAEVIELARSSGLAGIEWGGDVHVPHGDEALAASIGEMTRSAGLQVSAYGSYFRAGHSEQEGLPFARVLASARALGAPVIRIWAGTRGSAASDEAHREWVVRECRRVAGQAAEAGIRVALEYHGNTLTDTLDSTRRLLESVNHPNLRSLWQPVNGTPVAGRLEELRVLEPWLEHVHVFNWSSTGQRLPLEPGMDLWRPCLQWLKKSRPGCAVLLEFVEGDQPESCVRDAATLGSWIQGLD